MHIRSDICIGVFFAWKYASNFLTKTFFKMMELFILFGGLYSLYVVGMAIATELDYREVNKK